MQTSQHILFPCGLFRGKLVGREIVLPLGILGNVVKSPIVGGDDPPMAVFSCLVTMMMLDWLRRRQQTKRLWISSGMHFLSLLHCFSSVVSLERMYGNISRY